MECINGDARELSKHLIESDVIISSPPYGNRLSDVAIQDGDPARMGYRQTVDVVLTSPPYENATLDGKNEDDRKRRLIKAGYDPEKYLGGRARNTVLKTYADVDTIITSPPYGEAQSGGGIATKGYHGPKHSPTDLVGNRSYVPSKFEHVDNISCLSYGDIDSIITSPPYENSRPFHDLNFMKNIVHEQNEKARRGETKAHYRSDEAELRYLNKIEGGDYEESENIGNLKGETYLGAMARVYQECYNVLTIQGKMVLVVKNFIRDKQVVRLDLDTIKLCESVGFNLIDRWFFDLPVKSFWKILYHKKYPDVPEVKYEDILVFEKGAAVPPKSRLEE